GDCRQKAMDRAAVYVRQSPGRFPPIADIFARMCTTTSTSILLVAVNARYGHCAFAARSLLANLGALRRQAAILETDLDAQPFQLAAEVVARRPRVAGFSVYLWNVRIVRETLAILRRVAPRVRVVLGGPEIVDGCAAGWRGLADDLVVGEGETAFRRICEEVPGSGTSQQPGKNGGEEPRVVLACPEPVSGLALPYDLYTDTDIAHRTIFVEASRGCPFVCAYCTSCGTGLRQISLEHLLPAIDRLLERGVRAFRFLDRSLNASEPPACGLLDFFLARHPGRLQLHFEIMPCRLTEPLRQRLAAFPPGVLHLEVGVQTLNESVARNIGRRVPNGTVLETLDFLSRATRATVHADLIFGLPGEDAASFAAGFDRLVRAFDFPELQVNLLKRLPGTPLANEPRFAGLVFNPHPPYELLAGDALDFAAICRLQQFARCWELVHNRGRFSRAAALLWQAGGASPHQRYQALAARIHAAEGRLHALGMERLGGHVAQFLQEDCGLPAAEAQAAVAADVAG
ncbi:MAG: DUF4080 domain-containing protein, partial [bacterium]